MLIKIKDDLDNILNFDPTMWESLRNTKVFATGCTGFIGSWFIYSFIEANEKFFLNAKMSLLTRSADKFYKKYPDVKNFPCIEILVGDIRDFSLTKSSYDYVIHGATEVAAFQTGSQQSELIDVSFYGTKRVVEFCKLNDVKKVLFLSSGAAFGTQPFELTHMDETYNGSPDVRSSKSSYGEAKRLGEMLLFNENTFESSSARIFAACGPFLPMDSDFAFANFLKSCIKSENIVIKSNGKTLRSYFYASDLVLALWLVLLKGRNKEIYNIGSDKEVSIAKLASEIKEVLKKPIHVEVKGTETGYSRYVPSNKKIKEEFGLTSFVDLKESIKKTYDFYKDQV